jgi:hypothetical protein
MELIYQDETKRGKARFTKPPKLSLETEAAGTKESPHQEEDARMANVFVDLGKVALYGRVKIDGTDLPAATGKGLWGTIKQRKLAYCLALNRRRIGNWRKRSLLPQEDDIPL